MPKYLVSPVSHCIGYSVSNCLVLSVNGNIVDFVQFIWTPVSPPYRIFSRIIGLKLSFGLIKYTVMSSAYIEINSPLDVNPMAL